VMIKKYTRYLPLVYGGALALLAAPMLMESLVLLPGNAALTMLMSNKPVRPESLDILARSSEMALSVRESGKSWSQLALALAHKAGSCEPGSSEQTDELERARKAQINGLRLQPANPHSWLRLAYINLRLGDMEKAAAALYMSYVTGPYEIYLAEYRLTISATMWNYLDERTTMAVFDEVRLLHAQNPGWLDQRMKSSDAVRNIARQAL